jgi:threonine dehydrogenase-like Zn-dependent dehydrogenase
MIEDCPDPGIEVDDDVVVRVTATAVCGSEYRAIADGSAAIKTIEYVGPHSSGWGAIAETARTIHARIDVSRNETC